MLREIRAKIASFLKHENGPTSVEYALILGAIIVIGITAITSLGKGSNETEHKNGTRNNKTVSRSQK